MGEGEGEGAPAAERAAGAAGEGAPSCGLRVVPSCGCSCQWLQASSFVALALRVLEPCAAAGAMFPPGARSVPVAMLGKLARGGGWRSFIEIERAGTHPQSANCRRG